MQRFIEKTGFCPAPWQKQFSFTEYSKCCVVIENTSFRHSDVHQFCLTLPGGTWGEIKTYIQYKIWSLFNALKDRNNLWALPGWSYGPSSLSHHFSVLICREASADTCGGGFGPQCFITCFFSTVYCWSWSWRYCSFPRKWAGAL